jgi:hypothetical protein
MEQLSAEASMVFMGNTQKSVATMLKHSHFYEPLPDKYIDSAFLDRIHAFNPGWEVQPVRHELFCTVYGFVVDYISEVLKHLRTEDYTGTGMPMETKAPPLGWSSSASMLCWCSSTPSTSWRKGRYPRHRAPMALAVGRLGLRIGGGFAASAGMAGGRTRGNAYPASPAQGCAAAAVRC